MNKSKTLIFIVGLLCSMFSISANALSLSDLGLSSVPTNTARVKIGVDSGCVEYKGKKDCAYDNRGNNGGQHYVSAPTTDLNGAYKASDLKRGNSWEMIEVKDPQWAKNLESLDDYLDKQKPNF